MARSSKRYFGSVRRLPSGRWQARYTGPDGISRTGPVTFDGRQYADSYLSRVHADIQAGRWVSPDAPKPAGPPTLAEYAAVWLARPELAGRTLDSYRRILDRHILPAFGGQPVPSITPAAVRQWHARLGEQTGPSMRAHAYGQLAAILASAAADEVIQSNPCRIRGAGSAKRQKQIRPATLEELAAIAEAMPGRFRLMVWLAAWCALRFGELAELRRSDIDVRAGVVRVRRAVALLPGGPVVKSPKSDAGSRDVTIPPHLMPLVRDHLAVHVPPSRDALLFPAAGGPRVHMASSTLHSLFYPARAAAGRPDLRFHDLRHTGAVLAAATGATLAELMARLGHSSPQIAMRYQHAAQDRDRVIAEALSKMAAAGTVTHITAAKSAAK